MLGGVLLEELDRQLQVTHALPVQRDGAIIRAGAISKDSVLGQKEGL